METLKHIGIIIVLALPGYHFIKWFIISIYMGPIYLREFSWGMFLDEVDVKNKLSEEEYKLHTKKRKSLCNLVKILLSYVLFLTTILAYTSIAN